MKVLIVDDEQMLCEWLQFCIGQNPACSLVGVAHNGREALELYHETEPELILTDIKMPVMDGLELLHALRACGCTAMIVMLTAFAEFDMVRQALREGANEYLIKTEMSNEKLQAILRRAALRCSAQPQLGSGATGRDYAIIRNLLRREGTLTGEQLEELRQCGIRWKDNGLFALAVWKHRILGDGLVLPQDERIREVIGFDYNDRIYVAVGNLYRTVSSADKRARLLHYARQIQNSNDCMVGISGLTDTMESMPGMIRQAAYSLSQGFYEGKLTLYEPAQPMEKLLEQVASWRSEIPAMYMKLYQQSPEEQLNCVESFLRETELLRIADVESVMKVCADLYGMFVCEAQAKSIPLPQMAEQRERLMQCVRMQEAQELVLDVAGRCVEAPSTSKPRSKAIILAVDYIRANYAGQISLEQVATEVYLNPEYFSRVFRDEMGVNFTTYLTDLRLRRSVQLLAGTAMRVQDVAREVGYPNVSYFSTTFKKKYGKSPYEYRRDS